MASSVTDTVRDIGCKLVNRAETVVGDDAREGVKRAKHIAREVRGDFTGNYGSSRKSKKPDPRKYYSRSSSR
jgi:hypothetical protein